MSKENQIEDNLIEQLKGLKYIYRPDIVDCAMTPTKSHTHCQAAHASPHPKPGKECAQFSVSGESRK